MLGCDPVRGLGAALVLAWWSTADAVPVDPPPVHLRVRPDRPRLGDLALLEVSLPPEDRFDSAGARDRGGLGEVRAFGCRYVLAPTAGHPSAWHGAIAVPADASAGPHTLQVRTPSLETPIPVRIELEPRTVDVTRLRVAPRFTNEEKSPALVARLKAEATRMRRMWSRPPTTPLAEGAFVRPAPGRVTGRYGTERRFNQTVQSVHYGLDIGAPIGTPVKAALPGRVAMSEDRWAAGRTVFIDHGAGLFTAYFHLARRRVRPGETIRAGQIIGDVGKSGRVTGPHLHFGLAVRCMREQSSEARGMYVDPEPWLDGRWGTLP
ncbi:MAG: M23 family metallopeptidase [Myxococcota bacterium]